MASQSLAQGSRIRKMAIMKKMGWTTVGAMLAARRKELKLTLQQVADLSGTHKGYICGIEQGSLNPPAPTILTLICKALVMDADPILLRAWAEKAPIQILPVVVGLFPKPKESALQKVQA